MIQVVGASKRRHFVEPFTHSFINLKVFVFPPLHLIEQFLESSLNWGANVLVAVLLVTVALDAGIASCLLHSYGFFQGIFTRTQANHTRPCQQWDLQWVYTTCLLAADLFIQQEPPMQIF